MSSSSSGIPRSTPQRFAGASDPNGGRRAQSHGGRRYTPVPEQGSRTAMMVEDIDAWLRTAAAKVHEQAPALTALDQAIGDGDHGINLDRGFSAIVAMLDARPPSDPTASDTPAAA